MYSGTTRAIILTMLFLNPIVSFANIIPSIDNTEQICLAKVIYHESRGESELAKKGVAKVVLNRKDHKDFPKTICKIVNQKEKKNGRIVCQFSWICTRAKVDTKSEEWTYAKNMSGQILNNMIQLPAFNSDVLYFNRSKDSFGSGYKRVRRYDNTSFYVKKV